MHRLVQMKPLRVVELFQCSLVHRLFVWSAVTVSLACSAVEVGDTDTFEVPESGRRWRVRVIRENGRRWSVCVSRESVRRWSAYVSMFVFARGGARG